MDRRAAHRFAQEQATRLLAAAGFAVAGAEPPSWHVPIPPTRDERASLRFLRFVLAERDTRAGRSA